MEHEGPDVLSMGLASLRLDGGGRHSAEAGKNGRLDDSDLPGPSAEAALAGMGPVLEALREVTGQCSTFVLV